MKRSPTGWQCSQWIPVVLPLPLRHSLAYGEARWWSWLFILLLLLFDLCLSLALSISRISKAQSGWFRVPFKIWPDNDVSPLAIQTFPGRTLSTHVWYFKVKTSVTWLWGPKKLFAIPSSLWSDHLYPLWVALLAHSLEVLSKSLTCPQASLVSTYKVTTLSVSLCL